MNGRGTSNQLSVSDPVVAIRASYAAVQHRSLQPMFGRCKRSLSAAARDKGDGLDLDLRRLCASEATCARKRLASDDPRAAMRRLRLMFSAAMRRNRPSCIFMARQGIAILF